MREWFGTNRGTLGKAVVVGVMIAAPLSAIAVAVVANHPRHSAVASAPSTPDSPVVASSEPTPSPTQEPTPSPTPVVVIPRSTAVLAPAPAKPPPASTVPQISSIYFINAFEGWASGGYVDPTFVTTGPTTLFHTTDGGRSWQRLALPPGVSWSGSIHFADSRNGWVTAVLSRESRLLVTHDGGQSWATSLGPSSHGGWSLSRRPGPPAVAWGPSLGYYDPNQQVPRLWVSRDGAATWNSVLVPAAISRFRDVDMLGGTIYGLAELFQKSTSDPSHALFTSSDWGQTWQQLGTLDPLAARLSLLDSQHAFAFGGIQTGSLTGTPSNPRSALQVTADGGRSWSSLSLPANVACRFGDFFDQQSGWLGCRDVNDAPQMLWTGDGGVSWTIRPVTGPDSPVYDGDSEFLGTATGWDAGSGASYHGQIMWTTDGGQTWTASKIS